MNEKLLNLLDVEIEKTREKLQALENARSILIRVSSPTNNEVKDPNVVFTNVSNPPSNEVIQNKSWVFKHYKVERTLDNLLRFTNNDGDILGFINGNISSCVRLLDNGSDPMKGGWEDGLGNTINLFGWGDYYPKSLKQALKRVSAVYETENLSYYYSKYHLEQNLHLPKFKHSYGYLSRMNGIEFPIVIDIDGDSTRTYSDLETFIKYYPRHAKEREGNTEYWKNPIIDKLSEQHDKQE